MNFSLHTTTLLGEHYDHGWDYDLPVGADSMDHPLSKLEKTPYPMKFFQKSY